MMSLLLLPALAVFVAFEWQRVRKEHAYLARSKAIMAQCDEALRSQSSFLTGSRAMLDGLRARITHVQSEGQREDLQRHLDELLAVCNRLRFGTYSDNPALDVVLLSYEQRFTEAGVRVDYQISPLNCNGEHVALNAQALLEWALQGYLRSDDAKNRMPRQDGLGPQLKFRAFRRANQLLFEVLLSTGNGYMPYVRSSDRLPVSGTVVSEWRKDGMLGARLLVEGGAA
jgi:hypothetical protein